MKGASISPCCQYRYTLTRRFSGDAREALFIMLNPSTADAIQDDPTIRRCLGFAAREGCGQLTVVNLFAFRATRPEDLIKAADPVGPVNDRYLADQIRTHRESGGLIVAAWGAHDFARMRAREVAKRGPFHCLGMTKAGDPRHPLYVRGDQPLVLWEAA
jgi:hypothetical protein